MALSAVVLGGAALAVRLNAAPPRVTAGPRPTNGEIRIPLARLGADARFLTYQAPGSGARVEYFVLRDPDGRAVAALNACAICHAARRGFEQVGDAMRCGRCGRRFEVTHLGDLQDRCAPIGLASRVDGRDLVLREEDLQAGARYF